jgi:hypothetical protein
MIFFDVNFSFAEKNALELQACQVAGPQKQRVCPATRASGAMRHSVTDTRELDFNF